MDTSQQKGCSEVVVIKSILIVEDEPLLGNLLLEMIQEETTYQGYLASSGESALNMLSTITPALFLLDYHLPGMNGLELADHLRRREGGKPCPILLMSADLPPGNGVLDHLRTLQKPFDLEVLLQLIAELLAL
ncbi:response regulator [Ktedonobacter racemifer]|uniref:Response regulator receiver protein n=1 Tax=Ktedonobacter racemifer DSM 44963 TaxID=485913 RepID=D6U327_KTERA|nr:response regulator [Ktedonobacter racemifer]EFH82932.1 response regulator receiver protein [Ktedonobacter racemifer DSM 44963]